MTKHRSRDKVVVIPYNVPDNLEAREEAIRTGNCIQTQFHGSCLPPYFPSGMRIHFHDNDDVTWEHWDGGEKT